MAIMKRDYLRDFSGFLSEGYSSKRLSPQKQRLVDELKKLHAVEKNLQLIELDYVQAGDSERDELYVRLKDQIDRVKNLEWNVGQAYRQAGIDDIVER